MTDRQPFDDIRALLPLMPQASEKHVAAVRARDAQLTKPAGALGRLEEIVAHMAAWQAKEKPTADRAHTVVFAANHGVAARGVSPWPTSVTRAMLENFAAGGAAVNQICVEPSASASRSSNWRSIMPTKDITQEAGDG
jgi:nicotinate-nucleotide--dimethylbenzimidazole phosphoribosyltransferase